jgi:hypothetical protein
MSTTGAAVEDLVIMKMSGETPVPLQSRFSAGMTSAPPAVTAQY